MPSGVGDVLGSRGRWARLGVTVLTVAAALVATPSPPAGAAVPTFWFCEAVPPGSSGFADVGDAGDHARNVECLRGGGFASGLNPTTFDPRGTVSRAQMATFIAQLIDVANALDPPGGPEIRDLPTDGADAFTDDEDTGRHEANINRLAAAGIVRGVGDGRFDPTGRVSRAQMATFIASALAFVRGSALTVGPDAFGDDDGIPGGHEPNINRLSSAGIVDGTAARTYDARGTVSRAQMATFVIRAMSYLSERGLVTPLPVPEPNRRVFSSATGVSIVPLDPTTAIGRTEVTFTGFGTTGAVDVALHDCAEVERLPDGEIVVANVFFRGEARTGVSTAARPAATAEAMDITSVQGVEQAEGAALVTDVRVAGDRVRVELESEVGESDCAFVVAWNDTEADDTVELWPRSNRPAEPYGVAGPIVFAAPEAPTGTVLTHNVLYADPTDVQGHAGIIVTRQHSYYWDLDDTFSELVDPTTPLPMATFEALISPGDNIEVRGADGAEYSRTAPNRLQVNGDEAGPRSSPPWTTATTVDAGESNPFGATVTVAAAPGPYRVATYCVHMYSANVFRADAEQDVFLRTQCGLDPDGELDRDGSTRDFFVDGLFPGRYVFYGQACGRLGCAPPGPGSAPVVVARGPIGSPVSTSVTFADVDGDARMSTADLLSLTFDVDMAAPADGDRMTVNVGPMYGEVICGTNAVCRLGADGRTITLALTGAPTNVRRPAGAPDVGFPYGVTHAVNRAGPNGGFTDASARMPWALPTSPDTTF